MTTSAMGLQQGAAIVCVGWQPYGRLAKDVDAVLENLNRDYRHLLDQNAPGAAQVTSAAEIPENATRARLRREKNSHRGISEKTSLRTFVADAVNQPFLEEISHLENLQHLEMDWPTTAQDLSPLTALRQLKVLKIKSPRTVVDFTPLLQLPALEVLFIENAKHMTTLDWLKPLSAQLVVLGIEGSMWTNQRIPSLTPLTGFLVEALFLTSTRIADGSLKPLQTMPNLKFIGTAKNASRAEFTALHAARPDVVCDWFRDEMWLPLSF